MNLSYILGRERKGFADARPQPVYLAALASGIVGRAALAASAASCTVSAPLGPPFHYLASPDIPNDPSSDPSVQHGKTIALNFVDPCKICMTVANAQFTGGISVTGALFLEPQAKKMTACSEQFIFGHLSSLHSALFSPLILALITLSDLCRASCVPP